VQQIAHAPDEDPRVPQVSLLHEALGRRRIGLLDEALNAPRAVHFFARLDVAEPGIRARWYDPDGHERTMPLRDVGGGRERLPESIGVADAPVRMHGEHDRVGPG